MFIKIYYDYNDCAWIIKDTNFTTFSRRIGVISAIIESYERQNMSPVPALYKYIIYRNKLRYIQFNGLFKPIVDILDKLTPMTAIDRELLKKYEYCLKNRLRKDWFLGEFKNISSIS